MRQKPELPEVLFAAPGRILYFPSCVIADVGKVAAVEERAGVDELRPLVTVGEASRGMTDVESHVHGLAGGDRRIELINGVEAVRADRDDMEGTVEVDVAHGGLDADCAALSRVCVGDVDLRDGSRIFVLEDKAAIAGEGT